MLCAAGVPLRVVRGPLLWPAAHCAGRRLVAAPQSLTSLLSADCRALLLSSML